MKVNINGIQMAYEVRGQQTPPVVLLHGFGLDRSIWRELVVEHLGDQQVILPDLRGHGESDAPSGVYDMPLLAHDVAGLLGHLGVAQVILCGHSMGGYVTLAFAEQFSEKLAGLGLITTNAQADSVEKRAGRYTLIEDVRTRGSIAVAENLAPRLSRDPEVIRKAYDLIGQSDPAGLIGSLRGMAEREDKTGLLGQIDLPALVIAGEDDQITNFEESKGMADNLPGGEFSGLPGVGHMPMLEDPEALGVALRGLIERTNQ